MLRQRRTAVLMSVGVATILGLAAAVLVAADRGDGQSGRTVSEARGLRACEETRATPVPQPTAAQLEAAGLDELPIAPTRDRVDLVAPPFSDPTKVTNPLFPIAKLHSAIMPGNPRAGNVYRPENIAGLVFEEVTVKETGKTVDGPRGPVRGAMVVRELHDDGSFEEKIFAPGYGEFFTGSGGDVEALALAVPTDALGRPLPADLRTLANGADEVFDAPQSRDWRRASAAPTG